MTTILFALAAAAATPPPATDNFGEPFPAFVPADVRLFVIDAQACTHFSGEPSSDEYPERKAFLEEMVAKTCTGIDDRKAKLERRYRRSAPIRQVISDAWEH
jgi:hypothetical protein